MEGSQPHKFLRNVSIHLTTRNPPIEQIKLKVTYLNKITQRNILRSQYNTDMNSDFYLYQAYTYKSEPRTSLQQPSLQEGHHTKARKVAKGNSNQLQRLSNIQGLLLLRPRVGSCYFQFSTDDLRGSAAGLWSTSEAGRSWFLLSAKESSSNMIDTPTAQNQGRHLTLLSQLSLHRGCPGKVLPH